MNPELPLCTERETDRFLLLMMQVSIEYAAQLKFLQRPGMTFDELKNALLEKFDVHDLEGIYAQRGPEIADQLALAPYLNVMFSGTMINIRRLANFGQLQGAVACLMICSCSQAFNKRFFKCWGLVERNSGHDIVSANRRRMYDRIVSGDRSALAELNQLNARQARLEGTRGDTGVEQVKAGASIDQVLRLSGMRSLGSLFSLSRLLLHRLFGRR